MVARITLGKKGLAESGRMETVIQKGEELRQKLLGLVVEDAKAFDSVMQAYRISKDKAEARQKAVQEATVKASEVPLTTLESSLEVLVLARDVAEVGSAAALSDVATAVAAARAAVDGAASNVLTNLNTLDDKKYVYKILERISEAKTRTIQLVAEVERVIASRSMTTKQ